MFINITYKVKFNDMPSKAMKGVKTPEQELHRKTHP